MKATLQIEGEWDGMRIIRKISVEESAPQKDQEEFMHQLRKYGYSCLMDYYHLLGNKEESLKMMEKYNEESRMP
jgi:hypothetical protein